MCRLSPDPSYDPDLCPSRLPALSTYSAMDKQLAPLRTQDYAEFCQALSDSVSTAVVLWDHFNACLTPSSMYFLVNNALHVNFKRFRWDTVRMEPYVLDSSASFPLPPILLQPAGNGDGRWTFTSLPKALYHSLSAGPSSSRQDNPSRHTSGQPDAFTLFGSDYLMRCSSLSNMVFVHPALVWDIVPAEVRNYYNMLAQEARMLNRTSSSNVALDPYTVLENRISPSHSQPLKPGSLPLCQAILPFNTRFWVR